VSAEVDQEKTCRKIYKEILKGCSPYKKDSGEFCYLKHFKEEDFGLLDTEFFVFFEEAISKGITPDKDQLKVLIDQEHWSEKKEEEISDVKGSIKEAEENLKRIVDVKQLKGRRKFVHELEDKLYALQKERSELIGMTCEVYASKKINEKIIYYSFFKDEDLRERSFSEEEFAGFSQADLQKKIQIYNEVTNFLTVKWIKKIAALPFFLNPFFLAKEDSFAFFGEPLINLTIYQTDLFSRGKYYKSILSESEGKEPPNEFYQDLDKLTEWYDRQYSIIQSKRRQEIAEAKQAAAKNKHGSRKTRMR
tara:strand:- start:3028 stop:3945 length:918 start_codon:yes stop_codon:yes gene_type:complete